MSFVFVHSSCEILVNAQATLSIGLASGMDLNSPPDAQFECFCGLTRVVLVCFLNIATFAVQHFAVGSAPAYLLLASVGSDSIMIASATRCGMQNIVSSFMVFAVCNVRMCSVRSSLFRLLFISPLFCLT